jgi:DNA (cytosine-5)-methyltransferase 1
VWNADRSGRATRDTVPCGAEARSGQPVGSGVCCDMADAARERGDGRQDTAEAAGWAGVETGGSPVADTDEPGSQGRAVLPERGYERSAWSDGVEWAIGADGKARRVKPGVRLLAHGVPARVGRLRAYGNAIVPQVAAEVIGAFLDTEA